MSVAYLRWNTIWPALCRVSVWTVLFKLLCSSVFSEFCFILDFSVLGTRLCFEEGICRGRRWKWLHLAHGKRTNICRLLALCWAFYVSLSCVSSSHLILEIISGKHSKLPNITQQVRLQLGLAWPPAPHLPLYIAHGVRLVPPYDSGMLGDW